MITGSGKLARMLRRSILLKIEKNDCCICCFLFLTDHVFPVNIKVSTVIMCHISFCLNNA